jgi:hypothetical protein
VTTGFNAGALVMGAPASPRALVRHADLFAAYANGLMLERDNTREAYLSHFAFGAEMQAHYAANRNSVANYVGPCWCRWLVLDIDRPDLADALADARKLVGALYQRYPALVGEVLVYFSGSKGFHVVVDLAHEPPPAAGFNRTARAFAEALAEAAGVSIDTGVYDVNRIVRLPNTRHPKTGRFKRRVFSEALFQMNAPGILEHAKHPAGDGLPTVRASAADMARDWRAAELTAARVAEVRAEHRRNGTPDARAPRDVLDVFRFGIAEGERHKQLFRAAAWLTEQGAPPALVSALLTEPGCDSGLTPKEVARQIACGIAHANQQSTQTKGNVTG